MLLILKALPPGVIEVFTAMHMFYKSVAGEHLLSVPFFLIRLGRVIEHIAIDQYSPQDTHLHTWNTKTQKTHLHTAVLYRKCT